MHILNTIGMVALVIFLGVSSVVLGAILVVSFVHFCLKLVLKKFEKEKMKGVENEPPRV